MSRFEGKTEEQLVALHTKGMAICEGVWAEMAKRYDSKADESRTCDASLLCGEARAMELEFKLLHAKADLIAAREGGVAMPKSGDR